MNIDIFVSNIYIDYTVDPLNSTGLNCMGPLTCKFFPISTVNVFSDFLNIFSIAHFFEDKSI